MKTMTERLREYRLNVLAKIVPADEYAPEHQRGACHGPASHEPGRHSGRIFVVPAGCGHPVYPLERGPRRPDETMDYAALMAARTQCREHEALTRRTLEPRRPSGKLELVIRSVVESMKEAA